MSKAFVSLLTLCALTVAACGKQASSTNSGPTSKAPTDDASLPTNRPGCSNTAAFVTDVSVPDNTNFKAGTAFTKTWRVKNTGTCTWNTKYTLVFLKGERMSAPAPQPIAVTKPGNTLDISVQLTAPATDAQYRADFEIHDPSGAPIIVDKTTLLWVIISVGSGSAASSGVGSTPGASSSGSSGTAATSGGPGYANATCVFSTSQANVDATIAAINAYRAKSGLAAYTLNSQLSAAAQAHSADMACNNFFTHTGSNGSTPASRVAASGYHASDLSENVYGSYPPLTGPGVVTWWATDQIDPRHNQNLISTKFTEIGVGYSFFGNYGYYVVDFATP